MPTLKRKKRCSVSEKLHMQDVDFDTAKYGQVIFLDQQIRELLCTPRDAGEGKTQSKTVTDGMQRSGRTCTVNCRVLGCLSDDRYWHQMDMATKLNSIG